MHVAHNEPSLLSAFDPARHEAERAFRNDEVYLEKLITNPHHVEFQIIAESHGHLGERGGATLRYRHSEHASPRP